MNHFLFVLLVVSLQVNTLLWFRFVWRRQTTWRSRCSKLALLLHSLLIVFTALELYFVNFVAVSDGFGFTLAAKRWRAKYNHPINSYGLRDREHPLTRLANKQRLFVVGDSFAAGHGLKDYRRRFANLLEEQMGDEWEVVVLAKGGWGTSEQIAALQTYPIEPHKLVLSYYVNDIEHAGVVAGLSKPSVWPSPPRLLAPIVQNSDFANYVYWRGYRYANTTDMGKAYWDYLETCFADPEVWKIHQGELDAFIGFAKKKRIPTYVVVFPNLVNSSASDPFVDKVIGYLAGQEVTVVDVREIIRGRNPADLIVNALDGHPNPKVHEDVANILFSKITTD